MLVKIHKSYRDVVAVCDSELIGKKFEEGRKQLHLNEFFNGEEKPEEEVLELMKDLEKEDVTFNIVGKKAIELALKAGVIKEEGISTIQDVPFALVLL
ncbi:hypothetical protein COV15_01705 [Candidatus Woesearchaeota archaeon CG10_big_fil_rev_8_21_14_0_10_34_12]|nr:MAG: hypothetical protein COV15_01705 [Candidatus Woesearchaeota archaeon CG10_big_fil_rev_8_21_14_0_10_34_12]